MTTRSWFGKVFCSPVTRTTRKAPAPHRPRVELLEDRLVPSAYRVTSLLDDGSTGTLRDAMIQANANPGADTIDLAVTGTIRLGGTQLPAITEDLTITGPGAGQLTVDAQDASRIVQVNRGASVSISGLTIANGMENRGGGILNAGVLTLSAVVLSGNHVVTFGGGIYSVGTLTLNDAVVTNNTAVTGDGIAVAFSSFTMIRTTVSSNSNNAGGSGAGIYIDDSTAQIRDSTVSGNSAGGVQLSASFGNASLTMSNTTITGNTASDATGAALHLDAAAAGKTASCTLTNVTISGNTLANAGGTGGIWLQPGFGVMKLRLDNTIVAGNTAAGAAADLLGTFDTLSSHNLIGQGGNLTNGQNGNLVGVTNPLLAPLGSNGGPTQTLPLLPGSPAIDAGSNDLAVGTGGQPLTTDQRGLPFVRIQGGTVDIGAFEAAQHTATAVRAAPGRSTYGQTVTFTATVTSGPFPVTGGTVTFTKGGAVLASAVPLDASGQASFTTAALPAGGHTITASYSGASGLPTSFGSVDQTVSPATLQVTANDTSRSYGTANPTFTYTISGLVNGDTLSTVSGSPTLTTTASTSSAPGSYTITAGLGTLSAANYTFSPVNGTLHVNPAPLTITANDATKIQGEANPAFNVSYSGFVNDEGPGVLGGTLTFGTPAMAGSPPGTYAITPGGLISPNYFITFVPGTLTVLGYGQATTTLQARVDAAGLPRGTQSALDAQLQAAIALFNAGDAAEGVGQLGAFINYVSAQRGKKIGATLADAWIAYAERIMTAVG